MAKKNKKNQSDEAKAAQNVEEQNKVEQQAQEQVTEQQVDPAEKIAQLEEQLEHEKKE